MPFKISLLFSILTLNTYAQPSSSNDWIDEKINPTENFYLFANGNWIKNHPTPNDYSRWSVFDELDKKIETQLHEMILNTPHTKYFSKRINQQLVAFFQSGMDFKKIEETREKPLNIYLEQINKIKTPDDLANVLAELHYLHTEGFFQFAKLNDMHRKHWTIAQIIQDGINLPDKSYYLLSDNHTLKIQKAYKKLLVQLFKNRGLAKVDAQKAAENSWFVEHALASISKEKSFFREPLNIDHPSTAKHLIQELPNLKLQAYFKKLNIADDTPINNTSQEFIQQVNQLLPKLKIQQIKDYLTARVLYTYGPYLNNHYSKAACEFSKQIEGFKSCPEQWKKVIKTMNEILPFALGDLYVENNATGEEKQMVEKIIQDIRATLQDKITKASWLSPETKARALKKLNLMEARVGYPNHSFDYTSLKINESNSFIENLIAAVRFEIKRQDNQINRTTNLNEWQMSPQSVNAYYDIANNQINIPLGILQPPFFDSHAPVSFNYAGIGTVIGHEISHGFDDEGAQFDENGNINNWWKPLEWKEYQAKTECIIQQFSHYIIPDTNLKVKGKLVRGEAIADNTGLHLSYESFQKTDYFNQKNNNRFTPTQEFFINFAHLWASNIRKEEAILRAHIDPHPPMIYRVNGTLENFKTFYQAFGEKPHKPEQDMCHIF